MPRLGGNAGYNSYYQIVQTPGYVVLTMETIHDARIIPLDGRPHRPHEHPAMERRLARPLGRRHAGRRHHQLFDQQQLQGLAREPASRRALHACRADTIELRNHARRSDDVDEAVDGDDSPQAKRRTSSTSTRATLAVSLFRVTSPAAYLSAAAFAAWLYGIELSTVQLLTGAAVGVVVSLGAVSLPNQVSFMGSHLPVLQAMGLPLEPLGIMLAVSSIPDLFMTVGNVTADVTAATLVARSRVA